MKKISVPKYKPTPIVNDTHFSDAHATQSTNATQMPGLGSPMDTFNPAAKSMLPQSPKFVQVTGKRPIAKGLTNKRMTQNI